MIYLIGSLRNPEIPNIANRLREAGMEVFDDWYAAGPEADEKWRDYERGRGHGYLEGLRGFAANHVFQFDRFHLERADSAVLVLPAGKSGHLELGWALGKGKRGYILLDNPDRWDVMYLFATGVFNTVEELVDELNASADLVPEVLCSYCRVSPANPHLGACFLCAGGLRDNRDSGRSGALSPWEREGMDFRRWAANQQLDEVDG